MAIYKPNLSFAEALFVGIFCSIFGEDKRSYLLRHHNVPFKDTEGRTRLHDFVIVTEGKQIAIEIEGEAYHNPALVGEEKFSDDLLRANAQILEGWMRVSYTPRNLSGNIEVVKKQLKELIGDSPKFIDYVFKEEDDEITFPKVERSRKTIMGREFDFETVSQAENLFQKYPELKRLQIEHMTPLIKARYPSAEEYLRYVVSRGMLHIVEEYDKHIKYSSDLTIDAFVNKYKQEGTNDVLKFMNVIKSFNLNALDNFFTILKHSIANCANECEKKPLVLQQLACSLNALHTGVSYETTIMPYEIGKKHLGDDEYKNFMNDLFLLRIAYDLTSMLFQNLSLKLGRPRSAIIGVTAGGNDFCYTILDKTQYDKGLHIEIPSRFFEDHIPAIAYLCTLNGSKIRRLLMDDNKFALRANVRFELPTSDEALNGALQDATFLNFNHAIVNRFFVETNPCEFIINAYNVKSITLLDGSEEGQIEYYFKVKYVDETIEVGSILFEYDHHCNFKFCPFEKYDLSFICEGDSTRYFDSSRYPTPDFVLYSNNLRRLKVIISACLRDLNIMEVENRDYTKQKASKQQVGEDDKRKRWSKIIWVPRKKIIYNKGKVEKLRMLKDRLNELIPVMVHGHLRRCENPSEKQIALAKEFGIIPPSGFTFVRPYSKQIDANYLTRYRSKSALMLLYSED